MEQSCSRRRPPPLPPLLLLLSLLWHSAAALPTPSPTLSAQPDPALDAETDSDATQKVLGSSVVTSVSVIMDLGNGTRAVLADPQPRPVAEARHPGSPAVVGSPPTLMHPDRYEFYTFDEAGDLVKKFMTLPQIQSIIAGGDGSPGIINAFPMQPQDLTPMHAPPPPPPNVVVVASDTHGTNTALGVDKVVNRVQDVLKEQLEANKNKVPVPGMSPPTAPLTQEAEDAAGAWSVLLPAMMGPSHDATSTASTPVATNVTKVPPTTLLPPVKDTATEKRPQYQTTSREGITETPAIRETVGYHAAELLPTEPPATVAPTAAPTTPKRSPSTQRRPTTPPPTVANPSTLKQASGPATESSASISSSQQSNDDSSQSSEDASSESVASTASASTGSGASLDSSESQEASIEVQTAPGAGPVEPLQPVAAPQPGQGAEESVAIKPQFVVSEKPVVPSEQEVFPLAAPTDRPVVAQTEPSEQPPAQTEQAAVPQAAPSEQTTVFETGSSGQPQEVHSEQPDLPGLEPAVVSTAQPSIWLASPSEQPAVVQSAPSEQETLPEAPLSEPSTVPQNLSEKQQSSQEQPADPQTTAIPTTTPSPRPTPFFIASETPMLIPVFEPSPETPFEQDNFGMLQPASPTPSPQTPKVPPQDLLPPQPPRPIFVPQTTQFLAQKQPESTAPPQPIQSTLKHAELEIPATKQPPAPASQVKEPEKPHLSTNLLPPLPEDSEPAASAATARPVAVKRPQTPFPAVKRPSTPQLEQTTRAEKLPPTTTIPPQDIPPLFLGLLPPYPDPLGDNNFPMPDEIPMFIDPFEPSRETTTTEVEPPITTYRPPFTSPASTPSKAAGTSEELDTTVDEAPDTTPKATATPAPSSTTQKPATEDITIALKYSPSDLNRPVQQPLQTTSAALSPSTSSNPIEVPDTEAPTTTLPTTEQSVKEEEPEGGLKNVPAESSEPQKLAEDQESAETSSSGSPEEAPVHVTSTTTTTELPKPSSTRPDPEIIPQPEDLTIDQELKDSVSSVISQIAQHQTTIVDDRTEDLPTTTPLITEVSEEDSTTVLSNLKSHVSSETEAPKEAPSTVPAITEDDLEETTINSGTTIPESETKEVGTTVFVKDTPEPEEITTTVATELETETVALTESEAEVTTIQEAESEEQAVSLKADVAASTSSHNPEDNNDSADNWDQTEATETPVNPTTETEDDATDKTMHLQGSGEEDDGLTVLKAEEIEKDIQKETEDDKENDALVKRQEEAEDTPSEGTTTTTKDTAAPTGTQPMTAAPSVATTTPRAVYVATTTPKTSTPFTIVVQDSPIVYEDEETFNSYTASDLEEISSTTAAPKTSTSSTTSQKTTTTPLAREEPATEPIITTTLRPQQSLNMGSDKEGTDIVNNSQEDEDTLAQKDNRFQVKIIPVGSQVFEEESQDLSHGQTQNWPKKPSQEHAGNQIQDQTKKEPEKQSVSQEEIEPERMAQRQPENEKESQTPTYTEEQSDKKQDSNEENQQESEEENEAATEDISLEVNEDEELQGNQLRNKPPREPVNKPETQTENLPGKADDEAEETPETTTLEVTATEAYPTTTPQQVVKAEEAATNNDDEVYNTRYEEASLDEGTESTVGSSAEVTTVPVTTVPAEEEATETATEARPAVQYDVQPAKEADSTTPAATEAYETTTAPETEAEATTVEEARDEEPAEITTVPPTEVQEVTTVKSTEPETTVAQTEKPKDDNTDDVVLEPGTTVEPRPEYIPEASSASPVLTKIGGQVGQTPRPSDPVVEMVTKSSTGVKDGENRPSATSRPRPPTTFVASPYEPSPSPATAFVELDPAPGENLGLEVTTLALSNDVRKFADLCNELAFRLWNAVTVRGVHSGRSVVMSPIGVTSILAMVFLGARGPTSGQMNDILKLDDMVTFNPHQVFRNVTESVVLGRNSGIATASFVRQLYSDRSKGKLLDFYKERAQQFYDGHVEEVNFSVISDLVRRRTNLLVKRQTRGRVPEYLRGSHIQLHPPLAAFGANIFQTDCSAASTEGRDGEMYFTVLPGSRQRRLVLVPAAVWRSGFLAGYDPHLDCTAVALGGAESLTSVVLLLPGQQGAVAPGDGVTQLERRLTAPQALRRSQGQGPLSHGPWQRVLRSLLPGPGLEVQIPRFSHRSLLNVTNALQRMGLKDLFSADRADLRGLNGVANDLHLSDIVQVNTFSTCAEWTQGTRHHSEVYPTGGGGAGRTGRGDLAGVPLALRPRQGREPEPSPAPPRLRFDRPFLYAVRHNPTGFLLHMGRFNPHLLH